MNNLDLLRKNIAELQKQLKKEEFRQKRKRGILKEGEFYLLSIQGYDADNNLKPEVENFVFFMPPSGFPVCMNGYFIWETIFIIDLLDSAPHYQKWKGKKISKEEAITYL